LGGIYLPNPLLELAHPLLPLLGHLLELGGIHLRNAWQELAGQLLQLGGICLRNPLLELGDPLLDLGGVGVAATGVLRDQSAAAQKRQGHAHHYL
jgi:hypothetical protein